MLCCSPAPPQVVPTGAGAADGAAGPATEDATAQQAQQEDRARDRVAEWERIAEQSYAADGDAAGWDSDGERCSRKPQSSEDAYLKVGLPVGWGGLGRLCSAACLPPYSGALPACLTD